MKKYILNLVLLLSGTSLFSATITVTNNNNSGSGSLRAAIASAVSGDLINFSGALANQSIILSSTLNIPIAKNLSIDGSGAPGLKISGNNAVRIFLLGSTYVQPTSLTISNLQLVDGFTTSTGAAIMAEHQGILNISNCTFARNNAHEGGSAIFSAFEGSSNIQNCTFTANVSVAANNESGSTVFLFGPNDQVVQNSTFINNKGINGAAIHGLNAPLLIEDCTFSGNITTDAVFDTGQPQDFLRGFGGAIYVDRATQGPPSTALGSIILRRCNFENNKGRSEGGACYLYTDETDNVLIEDCNFNNNEVLGLPGGGSSSSGGAISQMNNIKNKGFIVTNSTFSNNKSIEAGGAIRVFYADSKIENCTFFNNKSTLTQGDGYGSNGGALALFGMESSDVEITNSTFAQNYAGWVGGAILGPPSIKIKNNIFWNNTAGNGGNTWGINQHSTDNMIDLGGNFQFPDNGGDNVSTSVTIANAQLLPLAYNGGFTPTMGIPSSSPAINAGSGCSAFDQRGVARVGACDAGAFEYAPALPVKLIEFTIKPVDGKAKIEWSTASETNNGYFELERSADGFSFSKLNRIEAYSNPGGINRYFTYDNNPNLGVNYYKLIQYDLDGKANEKGVKTFNFDIHISEVSVYPNPVVNGKITVEIPNELNGQNKQIRLVNLLGESLKIIDLDGSIQQYIFDLSGVSKGVYFISINAGQKISSSRIIIQ